MENLKREKRVELLSPKIDVVFHAVFREDNKHILEALISDVLGERIKVETTDRNRYVDTAEANQKLGIMDLRAELEGGTQCNIEIQLQPQQYENERILYYWSDTYKRQLKRGNEYGKLNKTISIIILDHEIKELEGIEKLGTKWQIRDNENGKRILTDRLEIVIIEVPKAKRIYQKDRNNKIVHWMMFLDNPNKKEVEQIMGVNKDIRKAIRELEQVSGDEKIQRIAELREKAIRDEKAALAYALDNGYKEGFEKGVEEGIEKGIEKGIEQGIEKGIQEGKEDKLIEIVKSMIEKNLEKDVIKEVTGITEEEFNRIKELKQ